MLKVVKENESLAKEQIQEALTLYYLGKHARIIETLYALSTCQDDKGNIHATNREIGTLIGKSEGAVAYRLKMIRQSYPDCIQVCSAATINQKRTNILKIRTIKIDWQGIIAKMRKETDEALGEQEKHCDSNTIGKSPMISSAARGAVHIR